jgi:hypothetical protein
MQTWMRRNIGLIFAFDAFAFTHNIFDLIAADRTGDLTFPEKKVFHGINYWLAIVFSLHTGSN